MNFHSMIDSQIATIESHISALNKALEDLRLIRSVATQAQFTSALLSTVNVQVTTTPPPECTAIETMLHAMNRLAHHSHVETKRYLTQVTPPECAKFEGPSINRITAWFAARIHKCATISEIAEGTGLNPSSVRQTIYNLHPARFERISVGPGTKRRLFRFKCQDDAIDDDELSTNAVGER